MGFLFAIGLTLAAYFLGKRAAAPASSSGPTPTVPPQTVPAGTTTTPAMILNAILHGGTAAQKQAAVMSYQTAKGMVPSGIYTQQVHDALVADGIGAPPDPVSVSD